MKPTAAIQLAGLTLLGCASNALLQTAHTTPPVALRIATGLGTNVNEHSNDNDRHPLIGLSGELGARIGVTRFLDVGAAPFFRAGAAVDAKANLMPSTEAFALAPRLRLGYAVPEDSSVFLAEAGAIGSYRFWDWLEPYVALGFANHWLDYPVETWDLESNQSLASRKGYGDGLVKAHLGIDATLWRGLGVLTEYGFWKTVQNDPGDGFKFVDNHVFAMAIRYRGG